MAVLAALAPPAESTIAVGATVLAGVMCRFDPANPATLQFGPIDPASRMSKTASLTITYHCGGSVPVVTWSVRPENGTSTDTSREAREGGASHRLIRYALDAPAPATPPRTAALRLVVSGTLMPSQPVEAVREPDAESVVLTITP